MLKQLNREQKVMLLVLSLINFINYVDRQVVFPLFHLIKLEFGVSDFELGLLGTLFMLVHSLMSVPFGMLADKYSRKAIIFGGVLFWSLSTLATGLSSSFRMLLGVRSVVGIGEASYAPAATAMISDNLPENVRARAQGWFNSGMFVGGTCGAMIGGVVAYYASNWRLAFFLVSVPGLLLSWAVSRLKDRQRHSPDPGVSIFSLLRNVPYLWVLVSGTLTTFAAGALISWGVEFVVRYKGYNLRDASLILGLSLMLAGVAGVFLGSWLADVLHKKYAWGRSIVVGASLMLAAPFMYAGLSDIGGAGFLTFFFLSTLLLSVYHGPSTAVLHDLVPEKMRATAFAVYVLVIHLLGDTLAPAVVGRLSDLYGLQSALKFSTVFILLGGLAFCVVSMVVAKKSLPFKVYAAEA